MKISDDRLNELLQQTDFVDKEGNITPAAQKRLNRDEEIKRIQEEDIVRHNLVIPSRMSTMDSFLLGVGEGANDVVEGVKEVGYNLTGNQEALDQMNRDAAGRAEYMNQSQHQGARFVGNLAGAAGMTAPLNLIPGLGVVSGVQKVAKAGTGAERVAAMAELGALSPAKQGIIEGGLAPTRGQDNRIENMIIGGVMGKGGEYAVKGGVKAYTALKNRSKSLDDLKKDASLLPGEKSELDELEKLSAAADRTGLEVPTSTYLDPTGNLKNIIAKTEQTPLIGNPGIRERNVRNVDANIKVREDVDLTARQAMQNIVDDPKISAEVKAKAQAKINDPKKRDFYETIADLYNASKWKAGAYLSNGFRNLESKTNKAMGFSDVPTQEEVLKFNAKLMNGEVEQTQVFNQRRVNLEKEQLAEYDKLGGQLVKDGLPVDTAKKAVPKLTPSTAPTKSRLVLDSKGNPILIDQAATTKPHYKMTSVDRPITKEQRNVITFSRLWELEKKLDGKTSPAANMLREDLQKAQQELLARVPGGATELKALKQYHARYRAPYSNKNIAEFITKKTEELFEKTGRVDAKSLERAYARIPDEGKQEIVNSIIEKAVKASRSADGTITPEAFKNQLSKYKKLVEPMGKKFTQAYDDTLLVLDSIPKLDSRIGGGAGWAANAVLAGTSLAGVFFGHGLMTLAGALSIGGWLRYMAKLGSTPKGRQQLIKMRYAARNPKTIKHQKVLMDFMTNMSRGLSAQFQSDDWRASQ